MNQSLKNAYYDLEKRIKKDLKDSEELKQIIKIKENNVKLALQGKQGKHIDLYGKIQSEEKTISELKVKLQTATTRIAEDIKALQKPKLPIVPRSPHVNLIRPLTTGRDTSFDVGGKRRKSKRRKSKKRKSKKRK